jgi:tetratricopeptide (TPR) repeat protein
MSPLDQILKWITDHATALQVIVPAAIAIAGGIGAGLKWLLARRSDSALGDRDAMHGPKIRKSVPGDPVGHENTILLGNRSMALLGHGITSIATQLGYDIERHRPIGNQFQCYKVTVEPVFIEQQGEAAAKVAASRFQLPARNPDFVGRQDKIEEIKTSLRAEAPQVTALEGMGGTGKTDTGVEAAHGAVDEGCFKDAQLFLDLHGFSATAQPIAPADALRRLLRPFVAANEALPESEQALAARFREATRDFDMLLFLDNARNDEQVTPILPGHPGCMVLITSRNRLALSGLHPIDLAVMAPEEAADLAIKLANRRDANRLTCPQANEIAQRCGYLPLSIKMIANALSKTKGAEVGRYLENLGKLTKPLPALAKAKAVLALSLEALDAGSRGRWAALGVFEGAFDAKSAAAIWGVKDAGPLLEDLEQRSLVSFEAETKRYCLHDVLRAIALEEKPAWPRLFVLDIAQLLSYDARVHNPWPDLRNSWRRHAEYYFAILRAADAIYQTGRSNVGRGLAVLDAELANIRTAQRWAAGEFAKDERAAELAQEFPDHRCLWIRLEPDELLSWHKTSLAASKRRGDREGQARAFGNLGVIHQRRGELDRAEEFHNESLAIYEELSRKADVSREYRNLGLIYLDRGEFDRAEAMHQASLKIAKELDSNEDVAAQHNNLGLIYRIRGQLDCAEESFNKGLAIAEEFDSRGSMASLLMSLYGNLGTVYQMKGEFDRADEMHRKSLAMAEQLGDKAEMGRQLGNLGGVYERRNDRDRAVAYWRKALTLFREIGARREIEPTERMLRAAGVDPDRDE